MRASISLVAGPSVNVDQVIHDWPTWGILTDYLPGYQIRKVAVFRLNTITVGMIMDTTCVR